jgi:Domain of unknown function (DUF1707)
MLRASDSDREQIAQRLHRAMTDGRLRVEEFEERLGTALSARTYGELDRLVRDLPVPLPPAPRRRLHVPVWAAAVLGFAIMVAALSLLASLGPHWHEVPAAAGQDPDRFGPFGPHAHHHLDGTFAAAAMLGPMIFVALAGGIAWLLSRQAAPADRG